MRNTFQTIDGRGLNRESFPMKLWEKAKKYGTWNPADIDFSQDKEDWKGLTDLEKEYFLRTVTAFQGGEEAVTLDLLPLIMAIAKDGRLEEEIYLTSFLWEEAKHVDGFNRFIREVLGKEMQDFRYLVVDSYEQIFYHHLPDALNALVEDSSPINLARASVTYNMIIEGVLAETGYYSFHKMLVENNIMPGMMKFVGKLKQDESRHIAYGIYLLSRLISEHGDEIWEEIQRQMNILLVPSLQLIQEAYNLYDEIPFNLDIDDLNQYAIGQFQKRLARLEKARTQSSHQVMAEALAEV